MALLNLPTNLPTGYVPTIDEWNIDYFGAINTRVNDVTFDQVSTSLSIDENNMVSDSAVRLPTQSSVKTYVDAKTGGVGGGGSTSESLELLNEIEKAVGSPLGFTPKYSINNSFTFDDNLVVNLSAAYTAGASAITMAMVSPIQSGQLVPEEHEYYIYDQVSQAFETFTVASAVAGNTYALNNVLTNSYASASTVIGRNFGNVNVGARQFEFSTISGASGLSANYYNERINHDTAAVLKTATVQAKFNTDTWFKVASVASATKQITFDIGSLSARLGEIATAGDGATIWAYCLQFNGNEYFQIGEGKRLTATATSYSAPNGIVTVSEDITSADVSAPTADQNTVCYIVLEAVKLRAAFGNRGAIETFSNITPSRIKAYDMGIAYPSYVHSHWKLNESSGNAINSRAGATFDLTQVGTVPSTAGKLGNSRGVYSSSNYFVWNSGGSSATVYDTVLFAVEGWFKGTAAAGIQSIIAKCNNIPNTGWGVTLGTDGKIYFFTAGGTPVVTTNTYGDNHWHYFTAVLFSNTGAGNKVVWVDGVQATTQSGHALTQATESLGIGARAGAGTAYTSEAATSLLIDSVSYWNTLPATLAEVLTTHTQRYAGGRGREYGLNIGHSLVAQVPNVSFDAGGYHTTQYKLIRNDKTTRNQLLSTQTNLV
jgi:hypothetical protein